MFLACRRFLATGPLTSVPRRLAGRGLRADLRPVPYHAVPSGRDTHPQTPFSPCFVGAEPPPRGTRSSELPRGADIALRPDRARAEARVAPRACRAERNPRVLISPPIGSHPPPIPVKCREGRGLTAAPPPSQRPAAGRAADWRVGAVAPPPRRRRRRRGSGQPWPWEGRARRGPARCVRGGGLRRGAGGRLSLRGRWGARWERS